MGITQVYLFLQKNLASFAHFLGGEKAVAVIFLQSVRLIGDFLADYDDQGGRITQKVFVMMDVAAQLGLNFPGEKCVT